MKDNGFTIVQPEIYNLVSYDDVYNNSNINKNKLLHQIVRNGSYDMEFGKHCIFDPNKIIEINYGLGAHNCNPTGIVKYYDRKQIYLFHAKLIGLQWYINKQLFLRGKLSETNRITGCGFHYNYSEQKMIEEFNNIYDKSIDIVETFKL
jgi:hypothetical protein